eukprot:758336-Hanusia_phi.AAC.3
MDDNIMNHGVGWDSSHLDDAISMEGHLDEPESCRSTAEVKVNGALMKGILEKDKNGLVKMTVSPPPAPLLHIPSASSSACLTWSQLVLPNISPSSTRTRDRAGVSVSDADLRIASALASVTNSQGDHDRNQAPVHLSLKGDQLLETGAMEHDPACRPKFDLDNVHDNFGHDLMESEFFTVMDHSDMRSHGTGDADHEDTVQLGRVDDESPSSCDSVPLKDIREARDLKLPTEPLSVDGWDDETHVWLTGDSGEHVKKETRGERGAAQAV